MATKNEIKKPLLHKFVVGVLIFAIIGILGVGLTASITGKNFLTSKAPDNEIKTVIYKDKSIDMNGDSILDYVIFAEVIIVGEDQNLPQSQSPQE